MRSMFFTRRFISDGEEPVTGTYKRLGIFLEATSGISSHLDLVVFVPPSVEISERTIATCSAGYTRWIRCPFSLHFIRRGLLLPVRRAIDKLRKPWSLYSPGAYDYYITSGPDQIREIARLLERQPQLLFVHRLIAMAPFLRSKIAHPALFFDLDDVEHRAMLRSITTPPHYRSKFLNLLHVPPLLLAEKRALAMALRSFVCSTTDREYLRRLYGAQRVQVVPNAVTIPLETPLPNSATLLFLGSAIFQPNLVGADWLIARVWPIIRAALPNARLIIAGEFPERLKEFKRQPSGVEFRGFVEDLDALYAEVRAVACPILSGSGTRFKIIEASAYGRPVVSTTVGAEGLSLRPEEDILIRDDPNGFANACVQLLCDRDRASLIGSNARQVVQALYERSQVIRSVGDSMMAALAEAQIA